MDCKPGDLAIHKTKGYLVYIIREGIYGDQILSVDKKTRWNVVGSTAPFWIVEYLGPPRIHTFDIGDRNTFQIAAVFKANLKPLRDNPGEDETLVWAGKPQKVTV